MSGDRKRFIKSATTSTPVVNSKSELEKLVTRYGCKSFAVQQDYENRRGTVTFVVPDTLDKGAADIPIQLDIDTRAVYDAMYGQPMKWSEHGRVFDPRGYRDKEMAQAGAGRMASGDSLGGRGAIGCRLGPAAHQRSVLRADADFVTRTVRCHGLWITLTSSHLAEAGRHCSRPCAHETRRRGPPPHPRGGTMSAQPAPPRRDDCVWTYDSYEGLYHTGCGQSFCYNDGDRLSNGAHYCYHCGGLIEERRPRYCEECGEEITGEAKVCGDCTEASHA